MANLNKVLLIGRLTADPELRRTPNDIPVASFTLAVNRRYSQNAQQQADFIDIVCWRNNAEFAAKYFTKGMAAFVSGTLQIRAWKDRDGNNRRSAEVVADDVQFAEPRRDGQQQRGDGMAAQPPAFTAGSPSDFEDMTGDDELPF